MDNLYSVIEGLILLLFGIFIIVFKRQFALIIHKAQKQSQAGNKLVSNENQLKYSENITFGAGIFFIVIGIIVAVQSF
jgi:hypothetical protein